MAKLVLPVEVEDAEQLELVAEELQTAAANAASYGSGSGLSPAAQQLVEGLAVRKRTDAAAWRELADQLQQHVEAAPVVHVGLAAAPDAQLRAELVGWFRREAHPGVLVQFRLQPDIAGGMVVRTTNKVHDFSFRRRLHEHAEILPALIAGEAAHG